MFNACRRGPASISRAFRAVASTTRIPSTRPSTLSLSLRSTPAPSLEARWLHVSSQLRGQGLASRLDERWDDEPYEEVESQPPPKEHRDVSKFEDLITHEMVHQNVVEAITKGMGHHTMTEVQTATINQGLQGTDM
jgi:ATP-dependent RNA helicase MSS116